MIAVVTGGAGFIGSRLAVRLAELGYEVRVVDVSPSPRSSVATFVADVRDEAALSPVMTGADIVFHLAGPVAGAVERDPQDAKQLQVDGTRVVVEIAARLAPRSRIVLASSYYVYSGALVPHVDETAELYADRMHPFGGIKYTAERIVWDAHRRLGRTTVICRIGSAYGPGDRCTNVVCEFYRSARQRNSIVVWGDPNRPNQFTHVDDIVDGLANLVDAESGIYNLVAPEVITTGELANLISASTGAVVTFDYDRPVGFWAPYIRSDWASERLGWRARRLANAIPL